MAAQFDSVFRRDLFAGKVMLVTGGGTGLGRCTAHELASLGATVALIGRTREKLDRVGAEIGELYFGARPDSVNFHTGKVRASCEPGGLPQEGFGFYP